MPQFSVSRSVPYTAEQVFAIARDVAKYKEFLPLVKRSLVRGVRMDEQGREHFEGELTVAYDKLRIEEVMTSRVTVDPAALTVTARSDQGPVKHLVSEWKIVPTGERRCDINFTVDYTLKSKMLQMVLSGMFDMAVRKIMSAFEERARQLYGPAIS
ncbi:type II toxin-antitoxin system RatA family toxin [Aestuariivirga litoralis]|uniref:Type II toxin-antitoxin system RatA family toxin n=1 Tax=Aestuariivirga litoralis TaxID=2650924 RepID=A0A2W2BM78_9HYPH|nr:type II toxin-antitoxin system RatA family toxin [Aestuariivirga litoralis]PZF76957.1 type II toxin-antitoxin system RatA family toxin [Aestuariivirga litoralis]